MLRQPALGCRLFFLFARNYIQMKNLFFVVTDCYGSESDGRAQTVAVDD
jgi:hypothetical protein